ncbi:MAG: TauD/TfdA dioxygenase family protein [Methylomicrobium sp.]
MNAVVSENQVTITEAAPGKVGAEVRGWDVTTFTPGCPEAEMLRQLIYRNKVVVMRGQRLDMTEQEQVNFARAVGRPQVYFQHNYHHPDHPEIFVSNNLNEDGKKFGVSGTGRYWHTDCSFEKHPLPFTSVRPIFFPKSARETSYIDMARVYRELPDDLRRYVDGAMAMQEAWPRYKVQACDLDRSIDELIANFKAECPPQAHPAVIEHPVTGEKILYISSGFTSGLVGLSYEENQRVMKALFEFAEQPKYMYTHFWDEGDIIIWDNRSLVHKGSKAKPGEYSRMYRIGIYDDLPFYVGIEQ